MTDRCIDEVAMPLRRLRLMPEELVTLKIIMLFSCGNHTHTGIARTQLGVVKDGFLEDSAIFISEESRKVVLDWKNRVIAALFQHYKSVDYENYEGTNRHKRKQIGSPGLA